MRFNRRRLFLAAAGITALGLGASLAWRSTRGDQYAGAAVGTLFAHTYEDADGVPQPMSQWQGRWLILNFWATWCAPCVEEMPTLQKIAREYEPRGVSVVGLGIDRPDAIRRFRSELNLQLPLLVGGASGSELARELGNVTGALPYTVLISPQRRRVQARLGLMSTELLRTWLDTSLGG
jgi:thiol-disulfide isomerase/thioredoxin